MKCMLDTVGYNMKPTTKAGEITKRIADLVVEITLEELLNSILAGKTFKPAVVGRTENDWVEQQLFALDFDDNITIEQIKEKCANLGILPAFGYTSFSHTEEKHKFRLIFANNEIIKDYDTAKMTQLCLMQIFNECDKQCKNLNRFYYGGISEIKFDINNRINAIELIEKYPLTDVDINDCKRKGKITKVSGDNGLIKGYHTIKEQEVKTQPNSNDIVLLEEHINNIRTIFYPEGKMSNIEAIRSRNGEFLKHKLNLDKRVFETDSDFFEFIRKDIDLSQLLEIKYPDSFRCILHKDNSSSAGIFKNEDGVYLYNCLSSSCKYSNKALNIITLIEVMCGFKTRQKTYEFIKEIFNLEIQETEFQKAQKDIIDNIYTAINGIGFNKDYISEFREYCSQADKNIKNVKGLFCTMLEIAKKNIYDEDYKDLDGNMIFFTSLGYLGARSNYNYFSRQSISQRLSVLIYHGLIKKLDDHEIPEKLLKKSQGYAIHSNSGDGFQKRINWYAIPAFIMDHYVDIEEQGKKWKKYGYTIAGSSREMFYLNEGKEVADYIYPQNKYKVDKSTGEIIDNTTSKMSDEKNSIIEKHMKKLIEEKSFCTQQEILELFSKEYGCHINSAKRQFKKVQASLLTKYDWTSVKCNKALKEQYNIDSDGYPLIFIKK